MLFDIIKIEYLTLEDLFIIKHDKFVPGKELTLRTTLFTYIRRADDTKRIDIDDRIGNEKQVKQILENKAKRKEKIQKIKQESGNLLKKEFRLISLAHSENEPIHIEKVVLRGGVLPDKHNNLSITLIRRDQLKNFLHYDKDSHTPIIFYQEKGGKPIYISRPEPPMKLEEAMEMLNKFKTTKYPSTQCTTPLDDYTPTLCEASAEFHRPHLTKLYTECTQNSGTLTPLSYPTVHSGTLVNKRNISQNTPQAQTALYLLPSSEAVVSQEPTSSSMESNDEPLQQLLDKCNERILKADPYKSPGSPEQQFLY